MGNAPPCAARGSENGRLPRSGICVALAVVLYRNSPLDQMPLCDFLAAAAL